MVSGGIQCRALEGRRNKNNKYSIPRVGIEPPNIAYSATIVPLRYDGPKSIVKRKHMHI